ncbi:aspartyl-phosphate phosphatase Spo0E family protein [Bacillus timonensis]|nr:aspartyl-phosphate phosphatase Spo0E family protein [Bacillus timonensis]
MENQLLWSIEYLREEMIQVGLEIGFSHPKTVKISQLLDDYINTFTKTMDH